MCRHVYIRVFRSAPPACCVSDDVNPQHENKVGAAPLGTKYLCYECGYVDKSSIGMKNHRHTQHGFYAPQQLYALDSLCPICMKEF